MELKRIKLDKVLLPSSKIEVKDVTGKGRGVFATVDLKKEEVVEIAPVIFISQIDTEVIQYTGLGHYIFTAAGTENSLIALGYASLYNHSSKENCYYISNDKVLIVKTLKDIKKGTELTIDYGWDKKYTKDFKY